MPRMDKKPEAKPADLTVRILEQIRDEMRQTRVDLKAELAQVRVDLTTEIAQTNERLARLEARQREDALRLSTEIVAVAKGIHQVRDALRDRKAERAVLGDHEKRIRALERKSA